jgi:hypothetical protein
MPPRNNDLRNTDTQKRILAEAPKLVTSLLALMEDLAQLMSHETDLVLQRKHAEHAELLKEKQKLALEYRSRMKSLAAEPDLLKKVADPVRAALKDAAQKLADVADRNARILRATIGATQRLVQNVVTMIRAEVDRKDTYKNPKTMHFERGTYSPTCDPVAVRRSV